MVRYLGGAADLVRAAHPEVVVGEGRVQAWVIGSGGGADAEQALSDALADGVPVVVDADGLTHVTARSACPRCSPRTPASSPGCSASSASEVEAEQLRFAREAAQRFDAVVLLKGRHTLVATPDGRGARDDGRAAVAGHRRRRRRARRAVRVAASPPGWTRSTPARSAPGCTAPRRSSPATAARSRRPDVARALPGPAAARCSRPGAVMTLPGIEPRAELVVDLDAIAANVANAQASVAGGAAMMTVVKADGYGHGIVEAARAARAGGADWLGVAVARGGARAARGR